jgi:hypothetical protein
LKLEGTTARTLDQQGQRHLELGQRRRRVQLGRTDRGQRHIRRDQALGAGRSHRARAVPRIHRFERLDEARVQRAFEALAGPGPQPIAQGLQRLGFGDDGGQGRRQLDQIFRLCLIGGVHGTKSRHERRQQPLPRAVGGFQDPVIIRFELGGANREGALAQGLPFVEHPLSDAPCLGGLNANRANQSIEPCRQVLPALALLGSKRRRMGAGLMRNRHCIPGESNRVEPCW